jgi:hypothetical protein
MAEPKLAGWLYSNSCKITPNLVSAVLRLRSTDERVQIDWLWSLSGVHSIMMVNSAYPGEVGGLPFYSIYHHEVVLYTPAEWAALLHRVGRVLSVSPVVGIGTPPPL